LLLDGAEGIQCRPRAAKRSNQKEDDTSTVIPGRSKCPLSTCDWEPFAAALALLAATSSSALAHKEIRHRRHRHRNQDRQHHALQRPASAYGVIGKTGRAYFRKINAEGGINGRKINFVSYDDA
jgi:hypothetical protein